MVQIIIFSLVALMLSNYGSPDSEQQSPKKPQYIKEQWVNEIQLNGTFRFLGKDFTLFVTPERNFWVEEEKFASDHSSI